jgi:hypothetical protein
MRVRDYHGAGTSSATFLLHEDVGVRRELLRDAQVATGPAKYCDTGGAKKWRENRPLGQQWIMRHRTGTA